VELLLAAGPNEVTRRISALTQTLRDRIAPAGFEFLSPMEEKNRCGILTCRHPRVSSDALWDSLTKNDVVVSLRRDRADRAWLRISPHFYNTEAEMQRMADLLMEGIRE
jgi:selenocysteine lyase/cysteine desulfurase